MDQIWGHNICRKRSLHRAAELPAKVFSRQFCLPSKTLLAKLFAGCFCFPGCLFALIYPFLLAVKFLSRQIDLPAGSFPGCLDLCRLLNCPKT
jgi:hypothetical protein